MNAREKRQDHDSLKWAVKIVNKYVQDVHGLREEMDALDSSKADGLQSQVEATGSK